jgi:hypothetical protein
MPRFSAEINGFMYQDLGIENNLFRVEIQDDDEELSAWTEGDPSEALFIGPLNFRIEAGGLFTFEFTNDQGEAVQEDFLILSILISGVPRYFVAPLPGSKFKDGYALDREVGWPTGGYGPHKWVDVTCFCAGSQIHSVSGSRAVEDIRVGDVLKTKTGLSRVHWVGRKALMSAQLRSNPNLYPVRISAGTLGSDLPRRDLLISRQHRMMINSKIARRMFNTSEVLISAIKLTALPGVYVDCNFDYIEYFHVLLDRHEIIYAEGAPTESLLLGSEALKGMDRDSLEEIRTIFPEAAEIDFFADPICNIPNGRLQKKLVSRHLKNNSPLL